MTSKHPFYLSINIMSLLILKFVNLNKYSLNANNRAFLLQCISELETRKLRGSWKFSLQLFTTAFLSTQFGLNADTTTFQNRLHSSSLCRLRLKNVAFAIEVLAHSCMAFILSTVASEQELVPCFYDTLTNATQYKQFFVFSINRTITFEDPFTMSNSVNIIS